MIKNTNADCKILDTKIAGSTAYVTLVIASSKPTPIPRAFNFYIYDINTGTSTLLSETRYWIDSYGNYNDNIREVDINLYKKITLQIDITNSNNSSMVDNKWYRECYLILVDVTSSPNINAWYSPTLELVSKEIILPEIKELILNTDALYGLTISWKYHYESQEDFNYNNKNIYTSIVIKSPYTNNILEQIDVMSEDYSSQYIKQTCLNTYTTPIIVSVLLKNLKGDILKRKDIFYKPVIRQTNTYIKTATGIKKVEAFYVKDSKEVTVPKVNFNLANVQVPMFGKLKAYFLNTKDLIVEYPYSTFDVTEIYVYLTKEENGQKKSFFLGSSNDKRYVHVIPSDTTQEELADFLSREIEIEVRGKSSKYEKTKIVKINASDIEAYTLPGDDLLCSPITLCNG